MVKKTGLKSISLLGLLCVFTFIFAFSNSVEAAPISDEAIVSDDFNSGALNESLWKKIDPLNDSTFTMAGIGTSDALLSITVPAGTAHDVWIDGNYAPRIMQAASNTNFEIETKFQSQVSLKYQMQGIIIEQDQNNFMRFEFHNNGSNTNIFAAIFTPNLTTGKLNYNVDTLSKINTGPSKNPIYLRIKRAGNQWTMNYSYNGIDWINGANFDYIINVTSVGPFAGNKGYSGTPAPAFTILIDYFFNMSSPIVPEDAMSSGHNITGSNIFDTNSNGVWDAGESGLSGWNIYLRNINTGDISSTITDNSGHYAFYNILGGTYQIIEETKPDYIATNSTSLVVTLSGSDITNLNFTNFMPQIPPIITTQPNDQTVKLGTKATFSVVAAGTKNLTYQWQKNNVNIAGAKGTSYTTPITTMSDNGATFRVIVTNPLGINISIPAKLTVRNIVSDDFNAPALNASTWTVIDPSGDAKITMEGTGTQDAVLNITIPGGISHDAWGVNNAPRVMQTANNSDFEIEAKFQSKISSPIQEQGIIIQQDNSNYLRFDFSRSSSTNIRVYAGSIIGGVGAKISTVSITPGDSPMYMRVKRIGNQWTQNYSFDGINWNTSASFSQILTVTSVGPFVGNSKYQTSPIPAFSGKIDYFFNTSSIIIPEDVVDTTAPEITLWYGNSQRFGYADIPQKWVNILGNVNDPSGVASLKYSLNSGSEQILSIGPDTLRLQSKGDFNVEIDHSLLLCGDNKIVIKAVDTPGNSKNETVSVNYVCNNVVPKNYNINWSNVTSIQDAGQIADGLWIKETNSIRPVNIGYDRLISIGNMTWDDYEITVPITLNAALDPASPSGGANFGIGMRWQGHSEDGHQPRDKWYPLGALGLYIWNKTTNDFVLKLVGTGNKAIGYDTSGMHLLPGVTYIFKMRAETVGSNTLYSLKVWEQNAPEPAGWTVSGYGVAGELKQGSMTLNSHYSDVSFGNVSIKSGPFNPDRPPNISSVSVESLGNSATVRWNTDMMATSNVTYGLTAAYENGSVVDGTMLFDHTITLANLTPGTMYHYKINSTNNGGNSTNTSDLNFTTKKVSVITSDDFSAPTLNTSIWTKIDPKGDANFTIEGTGTSDAVLNITIPGGISHDAYLPTNNAPRIMQAVSNTDFEVEAKFQSVMTSAYQETGIIIEQDSNNYLRFDFTSDSSTTIRVYSGAFINGIKTSQNIIGGLTPVKPLYMKVNRTGSQWKQSYSYDGINWIPGASFSQALTVNSIGPFVGNAGSPTPAFTGLIDYFFNTKSPVMPEDPVAPTPPSITEQPANQPAVNGSTATFNVVAAGTEPLSYQWKKNSIDIPNATGPSYKTPIVSMADNGAKFSVFVSNALGNVTSNEVTLSVIEAPPVTWWDTARHFRIPVTVNAASFERSEKPVELSLSFTDELKILGQTGSLDENSIRVVETNSLGE
ncbi:partial Endoglucanase C, partial [Methanosarcinales archaeon]